MTEAEWTQVLARASWGDKPLPHWIKPASAELGALSNESEWLSCSDPRLLLLYLERRTTVRKLRLFAVACCRAIWDLLPGEDCREKVELAEQFADGNVARDALERPYDTGYSIGKGLSNEAWRQGYAAFACFKAAEKSAWEAATHALTNAADARSYPDQRNFGQPQAALVRDVFGNPFRPAQLELSWLTPTVEDLATSIYADRAFDRMPILADALEDAGCTDAAILDHCRQPGAHVRGCWVVDLVLEKQ